MDDIFTFQDSDDIMFPSYKDWGEDTMQLYTYIDRQAANNLFKFFVGSFFNYITEYLNKNPILVPIVLFESSSIAKEVIKPSQNMQLIELSINKQSMYDQLNIVQQSKNNAEQLNKLKNSAYIWREIAKSGRYQYIQYTIRNKDIIKSIRLLDNI